MAGSLFRKFWAGVKRTCKGLNCREYLRHFGGGMYTRADAHHIFLLAGGLSFSLIICLIPLVLIVFSVAGMILQKPSIAEEISSFIDRVIPYGQYAAYIKGLIFARINEFTLYKNLAGIFGLVGLLFASSGLFSSMRTILNTIFKVKGEESVIVGKLRDFGFVIMVLFYFLLSTAVLPLLDVLTSFARRSDFIRQFWLNYIGDYALGLISFLLIAGAFFIVYFFIPAKHPPKRVVFVSALSTAVLWTVAKELFGFYIANAVNLKKIYGAYLLGIVVLFWIYYTSVVFIVGAEIGQLYREWHDKHIRRALDGHLG